MKIAYITSQYPSISETFIAREMRQLAALGHIIVIGRLKWVWPWQSEAGLQVKSALALRPQFNPILWLFGLGWTIRHKPRTLKSIWQDFIQEKGSLVNRVKLLTLLLITLRLAQCLSKENIQHIRAHFLHSEAVSAMWLGRLLDIPYSLTAHTLVIHFSNPLIYQAVRNAAFCTASTSETEKLLRDIRDSKQDIYMIRTGIDLTAFAPPTQVIQETDSPLILSVARLTEKKGLDLLIQACANLRDEEVQFICKIIGHGPEESALQELIESLSLQNHITLLGSRAFEELKSFYYQAAVFALPSREAIRKQDRDGLPLVIIEALACQTPVIATDFAGIPDLIIPGQTGLLVSPEDVSSLTTALRQALTNKDLCQRLAKAGRKKIEAEFDIQKTVQLLETAIMNHA